VSKTLPPSYFDDLYASKPDPWDFETSPYEAAKYQDTIAWLPRPCYQRGLEIGCSIGVLTARLAGRCDALLSLDVSERALASARARCQNLPVVQFARMVIPKEFPDGTFDLVVVSEVAYYWSVEDLAKAKDLIAEHQVEDGHLLLVHWTPIEKDHAQTGDAVHEAWLNDPRWRSVRSAQRDRYRIDLLERIWFLPRC
jgi:SAM-dependent methyltransferase